MGNSYDVNRKVALSFVQTEQMKGWFLAKARYLVIVLSGAMLFLGIVLLFGHLHFTLSLQFVLSLVGVIPIALVAGMLAIVIEGGTVFTSAVFKEVLEKTGRELEALQKVAAKFKQEELATRRKKIIKTRVFPAFIMMVFVTFSMLGSEVFWQEIMTGQEWYFHVIGGVLGLVCSTLLILLELKTETVERLIEKSISSSALIQLALDQSAKSQIYEVVFDSQQRYLSQPSTIDVMDVAVEQRVQGILADTVSKAGASVTAEQLKREIRKTREERAAAEAFLQSGDAGALQIPEESSAGAGIDIKRKSKNRVKVDKAVAKYGSNRIAEDLDKYADELGMDARTLRRHLSEAVAG